MLEFLWEGAIEAEGKEPASEKKRRKLREEGICVFSPLFGKTAMLIWLTFTIAFVVPTLAASLKVFAKACFTAAEGGLTPMVAFQGVARSCWYLFAFCLILPIMALLVGATQVGWQWSSAAFFPGESNSSGGPGLSRFFSGFQVGDAFVSGPMVILLLGSLYFLSGLSSSRFFLEILSQNLPQSASTFATQAATICLTATVVMAMAATIDYILRRRRFEVSIAMSPEEVRQEQYEDSGRPEVRAHRLDRAQELLDGGKVDVALIDGQGGLVLLGRHQGRGRPRIAGKMGPGSAAAMTPTLRARGIVTAYEPSLSLRLVMSKVGQAIDDSVVDDVVALYKRCAIGTTGG